MIRIYEVPISIGWIAYLQCIAYGFITLSAILWYE